MPNDPVVVHSTGTYMSDAQLDSIRTIYELDRQLNIEVRQEKEMMALNEARRNS
jgi:hypothetical protein